MATKDWRFLPADIQHRATVRQRSNSAFPRSKLLPLANATMLMCRLPMLKEPPSLPNRVAALMLRDQSTVRDIGHFLLRISKGISFKFSLVLLMFYYNTFVDGLKCYVRPDYWKDLKSHIQRFQSVNMLLLNNIKAILEFSVLLTEDPLINKMHLKEGVHLKSNSKKYLNLGSPY
ncbi:hypothetical protein NQ317_004761 [Molorchus minor]|uniref:Uncharacterized protein n=1 Tax=Molorchus minor TaxID=1323400 RepID=A0ABQ9JFL5_9CUCU|nr:hypothetical protein NQ317_004761 [Molorchus minor]